MLPFKDEHNRLEDNYIPPKTEKWLNRIFSEWIPMTMFCSWVLFWVLAAFTGVLSLDPPHSWFLNEITHIFFFLGSCALIALSFYTVFIIQLLDLLFVRIMTSYHKRKNQRSNTMAKLLKAFAQGAFWLIILRVLWEVLGHVPEIVDEFMKFILG